MNKSVFLISCLYLGLPASLTFTFSTLALTSEPDRKLIDIPEKAVMIRLTTTKQEIDIPRLASSSTLTTPLRSAKISVDTPALPTLAEVKSTLLIARHYNRSYPMTGDEQDWAKGAVWVPDNSLPPGSSPSQSINSLTPVFTKTLDFRVFAYDSSVSTQDGAGVDSVNISITDSSGKIVHERLEKNAGYCPFGGGEPECNVLDFSRSRYRWPNGTQIQSGLYQVNLQVNSKDTSKTQLFWSFNFEIQR